MLLRRETSPFCHFWLQEWRYHASAPVDSELRTPCTTGAAKRGADLGESFCCDVHWTAICLNTELEAKCGITVPPFYLLWSGWSSIISFHPFQKQNLPETITFPLTSEAISYVSTLMPLTYAIIFLTVGRGEFSKGKMPFYFC